MKKEEDYSSMSRRAMDVTRETNKGRPKTSPKIKVGHITIRPKECVLDSASEMLRHDTLVPSANRFCCPRIKPSNIKDVLSVWGQLNFDACVGNWSKQTFLK